MSWVTVGSDHYRITWNDDEVWYLKRAKKGAKVPWLLYTERTKDGRPVVDQEQGIRAATAEDAQHRAQHWLETAKYVQ
jgi:hypothetical protein